MDVHELTAAYALGALDAEERAAFEAHLGSCEPCRAELAALGETAAALAWGVESPAPPPALRERILGAAAAERENVVSLPVRRAWVTRSAAGIAAVAACAAVALGVWATTLSHSLHAERSARAAEARALQIVMDPASKQVALRGGQGKLAVDQTGRAVLVVHLLPAAPPHKVYEAWVIPPGSKPIKAGLFKGGGPLTMTLLDEMVPTGSVVATTVEPAGGVDSPTESPILTAQT